MSETRYTYPRAAYDLDQLHAELLALAVPGYLGLCAAGVEVQALFADALPPADADRVFAAVMGHVPRSAAERTTAATIEAIRTADDPNSRGNRASQTVLFTWLNDVREHVGLPRYTEAEILAAIAAATALGAGDPR